MHCIKVLVFDILLALNDEASLLFVRDDKYGFQNSASLTVMVLDFCFYELDVDCRWNIKCAKATVLRWRDKAERVDEEADDARLIVFVCGVFRSHFCHHAEPRSRYSTSLSPRLPTICFMPVLY